MLTLYAEMHFFLLNEVRPKRSLVVTKCHLFIYRWYEVRPNYNLNLRSYGQLLSLLLYQQPYMKIALCKTWFINVIWGKENMPLTSLYTLYNTVLCNHVKLFKNTTFYIPKNKTKHTIYIFDSDLFLYTISL